MAKKITGFINDKAVKEVIKKNAIKGLESDTKALVKTTVDRVKTAIERPKVKVDRNRIRRLVTNHRDNRKYEIKRKPNATVLVLSSKDYYEKIV